MRVVAIAALCLLTTFLHVSAAEPSLDLPSDGTQAGDYCVVVAPGFAPPVGVDPANCLAMLEEQLA
jgi:hypothetical protein